jgi:hypothetical protein
MGPGPFFVTPDGQRVLRMAYERGWVAVVVPLGGDGLRRQRYQAFATRHRVARRLTGVATLNMALSAARGEVRRASGADR